MTGAVPHVHGRGWMAAGGVVRGRGGTVRRGKRREASLEDAASYGAPSGDKRPEGRQRLCQHSVEHSKR